MIALKIDTDFGTVEITGNTQAELNGQVAQVEQAGDLFAAIGRLRANSGGMSAQANAGQALGAQVMDEAPRTPPAQQEPAPPAPEPQPEPSWTPPLILGQPAVPWSGVAQDGVTPLRAWRDPRPDVDPNAPGTDNPNDPRLALGLVQFWAWVQ